MTTLPNIAPPTLVGTSTTDRYPAPPLHLDSRARAALDGLRRETYSAAENQIAFYRNVRDTGLARAEGDRIADGIEQAIAPVLAELLERIETLTEAGR